MKGLRLTARGEAVADALALACAVASLGGVYSILRMIGF